MTDERERCGCGDYKPCGRNAAYCYAAASRFASPSIISSARTLRRPTVVAKAAPTPCVSHSILLKRERLSDVRVSRKDGDGEREARAAREYREQVRKAWQGGNMGRQMTMHSERLPSLEQYEWGSMSSFVPFRLRARNPHDAWRKQQQRAYA